MYDLKEAFQKIGFADVFWGIHLLDLKDTHSAFWWEMVNVNIKFVFVLLLFLSFLCYTLIPTKFLTITWWFIAATVSGENCLSQILTFTHEHYLSWVFLYYSSTVAVLKMSYLDS